MPLVRIDLIEGTTPDHRRAIADTVYDALTRVAGAPEDDRFMVVSEHRPENFVVDPTFMVERTDRAVLIQITFNTGRSTQVKKDMYRAIADGIHERTGMRTEDVFVSLVDVPKENWSFGGGEAQLA